jgi:hypothetical protein
MSKARGRRGKETVARHVRLYKWLMDTDAWKHLSPVARALYVELASRYMGSNNGRIPYSVREGAEGLRIGKSTAAQGLRELQQKGFVVARQVGAFSWKQRHSTEWRLTEFPCDVTKELASKEFARWSPENKVRYLRTDRTVPEGGPNGTPARTVDLQKARYGT